MHIRKKVKTYTDIVKQTKEQELIDMQTGEFRNFRIMLRLSFRKNRLNYFSQFMQKLIKPSKMLERKMDLFMFLMLQKEHFFILTKQRAPIFWLLQKPSLD